MGMNSMQQFMKSIGFCCVLGVVPFNIEEYLKSVMLFVLICMSIDN
jgi:hypothetical protein